VSGPANRDFVGHVGGDDFIVITGLDRAEALVAECIARCRGVVEKAVGLEAARRGSYTGLDREGSVRDFPLASVSAAVIQVHPESWVSLASLGQRAADAKRRAKQLGPGGVLVERA
jgi:hypothetical protein